MIYKTIKYTAELNKTTVRVTLKNNQVKEIDIFDELQLNKNTMEVRNSSIDLFNSISKKQPFHIHSFKSNKEFISVDDIKSFDKIITNKTTKEYTLKKNILTRNLSW